MQPKQGPNWRTYAGVGGKLWSSENAGPNHKTKRKWRDWNFNLSKYSSSPNEFNIRLTLLLSYEGKMSEKKKLRTHMNLFSSEFLSLNLFHARREIKKTKPIKYCFYSWKTAPTTGSLHPKNADKSPLNQKFQSSNSSNKLGALENSPILCYIEAIIGPKFIRNQAIQLNQHMQHVY